MPEPTPTREKVARTIWQRHGNTAAVRWDTLNEAGHASFYSTADAILELVLSDIRWGLGSLHAQAAKNTGGRIYEERQSTLADVLAMVEKLLPEEHDA